MCSAPKLHRPRKAAGPRSCCTSAFQSDQRGARAFYVGFVRDAADVRVGIAVIEIASALAELMARDVEVCAKGGAGCQAQALSPPQAAAPLQPAAKTKTSRVGGR